MSLLLIPLPLHLQADSYELATGSTTSKAWDYLNLGVH